MDKLEKKKKKAKIQLLIFFIFIVFAFTFAKMLDFMSNKNKTNDDDISYNLYNISKYNYNIAILVNGSTIYTYKGEFNNNSGSITNEDGSYVIINNLYYDRDYNQVDNIFYLLDTMYFSLDNIRTYINSAIYEDNKYKFSINYNGNAVSNILEQDIQEDKMVLKIDYTNLAKLYDSSISSYIVNYTLSNFI